MTDEDKAVWRVGRKVGRTIYRHGQLVGLVDTAAMAAEIVEAMNAKCADGEPT